MKSSYFRLVCTIAANSLCFFLMWSWFAVPYLNFPEIPLIAAAGLFYFIRFATRGPSHDAVEFIAEGRNTDGRLWITGVVYPVCMILLGGTIHFLDKVVL